MEEDTYTLSQRQKAEEESKATSSEVTKAPPTGTRHAIREQEETPYLAPFFFSPQKERGGGGKKQALFHILAFPTGQRQQYLHKDVHERQGGDDHGENGRAGNNNNHGGDGGEQGPQEHEHGGGQRLVDHVDVLGEAVDDAP